MSAEDFFIFYWSLRIFLDMNVFSVTSWMVLLINWILFIFFVGEVKGWRGREGEKMGGRGWVRSRHVAIVVLYASWPHCFIARLLALMLLYSWIYFGEYKNNGVSDVLPLLFLDTPCIYVYIYGRIKNKIVRVIKFIWLSVTNNLLFVIILFWWLIFVVCLIYYEFVVNGLWV